MRCEINFMRLCLVICCLPGPSMPSWIVTRACTSPAATRLVAPQHHGKREATRAAIDITALPKCDIFNAAPPLRSAPHMRVRAQLVATATVIHPVLIALDALAVLLKVAWRLAVAALLWSQLKPMLNLILNSVSPTINAYVRNINPMYVRPLLAFFAYSVCGPIVRRTLGPVVARIFPDESNKFVSPRRSLRRKRRLESNSVSDGGEGGGGGGGCGGGDGGGSDGCGGEGGGGNGDGGGQGSPEAGSPKTDATEDDSGAPYVPSTRRYKKGDFVLYTDRRGQKVPAQVITVHRELKPPYYTVVVNGDAKPYKKQTVSERLEPLHGP